MFTSDESDKSIPYKVPETAQKGPLKCTKRSTITVCVINDATVEELNKFCYPVS